MNMKIESLYICVSNMKRAINFWRQFFDQLPETEDNVMSMFNINGFRFFLFCPAKMKEKVIWGHNCLPSIEVDDIEIIYQKVIDLGGKIVFEKQQIGSNMVFEFRDLEGNDIEVFAKV